MKKRSALLIGVNRKGEVLLQHKTPDAPHNANLWVLFGGGIEQDESPEDAIKREIHEELGISPSVILFKTYRHSEEWGHVERNVFYASIDESAESLKDRQTEGDGLDFLSLPALKEVSLNEGHRSIVQEFVDSQAYRNLKTD